MEMKKGIEYVAGLLEGEGSFTNTSGKGMRITCVMTDRDVLERLQYTIGGKIYGPYNHSKGKPTYQYQLAINKEVLNIIPCIWPYMSSRRKDQITYMHRIYINRRVK